MGVRKWQRSKEPKKAKRPPKPKRVSPSIQSNQLIKTTKIPKKQLRHTMRKRQQKHKRKEQINEINEIQETINRLKDGQPIFANDAEIRLNHLNCSVSEMNVIAEELSKLRGTAGNLQVETELIYSKFDDTTVKISASLSKLQTKIADHAVEQSQMGND